MKRQPFTKRTIRLVGSPQVEAAINLLRNVPLDPAKPLVVAIGEESKARGLDANGYYWMRLGEIEEQAWLAGRQYSKDVWHEYAKKHLMPETITTKDGEVRSKWIESPDGSAIAISTTLLEKRCFAEYIEIVEAFGGTMGVHFSENPMRMAA